MSKLSVMDILNTPDGVKLRVSAMGLKKTIKTLVHYYNEYRRFKKDNEVLNMNIGIYKVSNDLQKTEIKLLKEELETLKNTELKIRCVSSIDLGEMEITK